MTTEERIEQDAINYARDHSAAPDKETPDWIILDYLTGAKSERNKTIDDCKAAIVEYWGKLHTRMRSQDRDEIRAILDSLKVNP